MPDDGYYNTRALARLVGGATGVEVVAVDLLDAAAVDQGLAGGGAALWVETPTNPLLRVADLAQLGDISRCHGARWPGESAPPGLIRLSVGVEGVADLIADVDMALASAVG